MTNEEYIQAVKRTESHNFKVIDERILHGAIGVCTEAGEIMDSIKKSLFYGRDLDTVNLVEEVGDVFWYLGILCDALGISFEEVQERNINKLKIRYPEKFDEKAERDRNYDNERKALL